MSEGIEIRRTPSIANDQPYLAEGAGVRVVDIVDRMRAGETAIDVSKDFGIKAESAQLLLAVVEAVTPDRLDELLDLERLQESPQVGEGAG